MSQDGTRPAERRRRRRAWQGKAERFAGDLELERRCRRLADAVPLDTFTLPGLVGAVADQQRCRIEMQPLPPNYSAEVTGAVVPTLDGYLIRHHDAACEWFTAVAVAHELGHILCQHLVRPILSASQGLGTEMEQRLDLLQSAFDDWGPLFRCDPVSPAEQEAELVGSFLLQRLEAGASRPVTRVGATCRQPARFAQLFTADDSAN